MDDGDGAVFLFDFYGALETNRANRAEDHCPRSGDQPESGSDQTDGQRQIQDDGVAFADANAADISFRNESFDFTYHVISELLEIIIGERLFFRSRLFSGVFRLRLLGCGLLRCGLFSSRFFSCGLLYYRLLYYRLFSLGGFNNLLFFTSALGASTTFSSSVTMISSLLILFSSIF